MPKSTGGARILPRGQAHDPGHPMNHLAFTTRALAAAALLLAAAALGAERPRDFVFSAYKLLGARPLSPPERISRPAEGAPPADRVALATLPDGLRALTWAFATGECGHETWGGLDPQRVSEANVAEFARAGIGYILSAGGPDGVFSCASDEGFERFLARYDSPLLLGVELDIDGRSKAAQIGPLVQRVLAAQRRHPQLRFSFTLATLAASDGSRAGLDTTGQAVLRAAREVGLSGFFVNLKVADYGDARPAHCVVMDDRCDMAASAMQAARNLEAAQRVPLARIELTPTIGRSDGAGSEFNPEDATRLARFVREQGLGGLHFWSLDRDLPCAAAAAGNECHGLAGVPPGRFQRALEAELPPGP